ncbi:MAG: hypothetical protein EBQ92_08150 [Proteobacteria bacterium]|nr:hypothetical protein [Pseudomonadota bacterium]
MQFKKSDFVVLKSTRKGKKYMAYLKNDPSKKIHFGALGYQQYKDSTPLKLYSEYDHNDKDRRDRYYARHKKDIVKGFNPGYLSFLFLWK